MRYSPLFVLILLYIGIGISQLAIINNIWHFSFDDGTYSHAFLIPFIVAYLYWIIYKENGLQFNKNLSVLNLVIAAGLGYGLLVFSWSHFTTGYRVFLIFYTTGLISLIFKPSIRLLFPSLFLLFLVPVWGALTQLLQNLSTEAVTLLMGLTHIPLYVEGNFITIPAGVFEIAGGCSGLRYMIVSLAISSLYVFLYVSRLKHSVIFICLAIFGALITNWLRISLLILIGHYTNMESSLMHDHNAFGWYLYIPFMIILFRVGQSFSSENQVVKDKSPTMNNQMSLGAILSVFVLLILTSDPIKLVLSKPVKATQSCETLSNDIPLPTIKTEHELCQVQTGDYVTLNYVFNGLALDSSVDYYLNQFVSDQWTIMNTSFDENWNYLKVIKGNKEFSIQYQFVAGSVSTSKLGTFKKAKLINALKGDSASKLIWQVTTH